MKRPFIYGENLIMRSNLSNKSLLVNLDMLDKARISPFEIPGKIDPDVIDNTRAIAEPCQKPGGQNKIINQGEDHCLIAPGDPILFSDYFTKVAKNSAGVEATKTLGASRQTM